MKLYAKLLFVGAISLGTAPLIPEPVFSVNLVLGFVCGVCGLILFIEECEDNKR